MRIVFAIGALLVLAACGADGAPEPVNSGVSIGGEARIGVVSG